MVSNVIKKNVLKPFIDETVKSLASMANLKAHAGEAFEDSVESFRFKGYAVAAKTYGKLEIVILLHNYIETALSIGNNLRRNILQEENELDELNEEMEAALAEWGNTAIGLATRSLEALNMGIRFEPPYFILNTEKIDPLLEDVDEIVSVPITIDGIGRFYLNLLIIDSEAKKERSQQKVQKSDNVLIVDDSSFVRKSMKRFLNSLGYENVIEASNGKEAVALHKEKSPAIIFMDVVMPELTGDAALEQIRKTDKNTPIVMLSSVSDSSIIDKCNSLGTAGYILKPLTAEDGPNILKKFL